MTAPSNVTPAPTRLATSTGSTPAAMSDTVTVPARAVTTPSQRLVGRPRIIGSLLRSVTGPVDVRAGREEVADEAPRLEVGRDPVRLARRRDGQRVVDPDPGSAVAAVDQRERSGLLLTGADAVVPT